MRDIAPRKSLLKALLAFSIVSTLLHYTHNFIRIDDYPDTFVNGTVIQIGILLSWPILTAIGLYGYRLYSRGDYRHAYPCLLAYSFLGLFTVGHFLDGTPDIPAFFFVTIFTDFIAGASIVAFTIWSATVTRGERVSDAPSA